MTHRLIDSLVADLTECSAIVSRLESGYQDAYSVDQAVTELRKARNHLRRADEFNRLADERGEK